jgi:ribonuclease Z
MNIRIILLFFIVSTASASTKLFILGTGTPNPNPERMGSSYLVLANDEPYLFDFGTGVIRRIAAFSPSWGGDYKALEVENIKHAFLTHIHSDHTLGLADLIITPWIMGRTDPLKIYGPKGAKNMHKNIIEAYQPDIDYRIYGTQPQNNTGYNVIFTELKDRFIYEDKNIKITAFLNDHGDLQESYGFFIETADKKILISGDTAKSKNLISYGDDLDYLIHEIYSQKGFNNKTPDWQKYHKAHHTGPKDVAEIANLLKPKNLILSHILFWGSSEEEILDEVKTFYSGTVIVAEDGMVFD